MCVWTLQNFFSLLYQHLTMTFRKETNFMRFTIFTKALTPTSYFTFTFFFQIDRVKLLWGLVRNYFGFVKFILTYFMCDDKS